MIKGLKIPQIKLKHISEWINNKSVYKLEITNAYTNALISDNKGNVFFVEPYSLNDFTASIRDQGFKIKNEKLILSFNFENKNQKVILDQPNIKIESDSELELNSKQKSKLIEFSKYETYLETIGLTTKIDTGKNIDLASLYAHKSNDYSKYENLINIFFDHNINTFDFSTNNIYSLPLPTAIVIPTFNSKNELIRLLHSLDNQNIYKDYFKKISIIIIDDNSNEEIQIYEKFKNLKSIKIIRNNINSFSGQARNQAYVNLTQDIVITLDSDLILESNFLINHIVLNHLYENFISMSCRENVDESKEFNLENVKSSLSKLKPDYKKDTRFKKTYPANELGGPGYEFTIMPFKQTNFFRDFGNNKELEMGISLPIMLKSHNFTCNIDLIRKAGFFSTFFNGWGDEDCFFGKKAIAVGAFMVPSIACSVFHVNHPPRLYTSEKEKLENLKQNVKTRNKRIKDNIYKHIN